MSLDWVPLETSAGARGEVYLEMTFYANSPPPLTRRPSKLRPSDRLARPAAQSRQSTSPSTSPSPQPGRSPATGDSEKKPSHPLASTSGASQIPLSLIPARGSQSQASRQASPNGGSTSVDAIKYKKDSLPPLPANNDPTGVDSGKNLGLPTALHPGGRSGPRPTPPQNRNRVMSMGRSSPEMLPNELHRRTLSDTPALAPPPPFSRLQAPVQAYPPDITPPIVVEEHGADHPPLAFPTPFAPPSGPTQEHEPRGVYASGDYDSFTYGPPGQVYVQPNSQTYIPAPAQGCPRTFSPSQGPMPLQSSLTPPGQPQQLYNTSPAMSSPPFIHQPYTQFPNGPPIAQPLPAPQTYPQPQQQQATYPPQPQQRLPLHQQSLAAQQQQYPPQQQYHPPHLPYTHPPHPPNINISQPYQQYQHPGLSLSSQPPMTPQPQSRYSQTVSSPPFLLSLAPSQHP